MSSTHAMRRRIDSVCPICGRTYRVVAAEIRRHPNKACSKRCGYDRARKYKEEELKELLLSRSPYKVISERLGISYTTISKFAKEVDLARSSIKYDWKEIEKRYSAGITVSQCAKEFGVSRSAISDAIYRGALPKRERLAPNKMTFAQLLLKHQGKRGNTVRAKFRRQVLEEKLLLYKCALCGISEWRGNSLTLRLDHISGDGRDHSIGNLRFICPNCDSQLPTFGHRNRGRYEQPMVDIVQR